MNVHYPKMTLIRGVEEMSRIFSMMFQRYPLEIKVFLPTKWYIIFLVLVYITSIIPYLKPYLNSFTIETFVYLVEMRLEWLDIPWGCTEACGRWKLFKTLYHLLNSSLFLLITNSPTQLGTFTIISHGKGAMYVSRLFSLP